MAVRSFSPVLLDLKMQQSEQHSVNVVSLRTKLTLEAGC